MLTFRNVQPELLPKLASALKPVFGDGAQDQCLFAHVKIHIKTIGVSKSQMYANK
jgi:hypothetical protein